jgi:RNA polymerase-binding protein DksA
VSAVDTERFRTVLLEERKRVADAIEYLHAENPGSIEDESEEIIGSVDNHLAETATVTLDREIDYTLEENSEHVLAAIDAALKRIDEGTYGICQNCGREIGEERLEAVPWATLCIDCKRRERQRL